MTNVIVTTTRGAARFPRATSHALWRVSAAEPADRHALEALFAACSEESIRLRFFGRLRAFPREYLDGALTAPPHAHDAVVAHLGDRDRLVGLASLVAGPVGTGHPSASGPDRRAAEPPAEPPAELAVLVGDAWQRQGAGTAMVGALLARARERGVVRVRASVLPGRTGLLAALSRHLEPDAGRSTCTREGLSTVYRLH